MLYNLSDLRYDREVEGMVGDAIPAIRASRTHWGGRRDELFKVEGGGWANDLIVSGQVPSVPEPRERGASVL